MIVDGTKIKREIERKCLSKEFVIKKSYMVRKTFYQMLSSRSFEVKEEHYKRICEILKLDGEKRKAIEAN